MDAKQTRLGIILALAAYFIWGIAPAYFKLIYYVPADEILTHRVIWSLFFMVALISVSRQWPVATGEKAAENAAQDLPAGALGSAGRR